MKWPHSLGWGAAFFVNELKPSSVMAPHTYYIIVTKSYDLPSWVPVIMW